MTTRRAEAHAWRMGNRRSLTLALVVAAGVALIRFKANLLLVLAACALAGLAAHASGL